MNSSTALIVATNSNIMSRYLVRIDNSTSSGFNLQNNLNMNETVGFTNE